MLTILLKTRNYKSLNPGNFWTVSGNFLGPSKNFLLKIFPGKTPKFPWEIFFSWDNFLISLEPLSSKDRMYEPFRHSLHLSMYLSLIVLLIHSWLFMIFIRLLLFLNFMNLFPWRRIFRKLSQLHRPLIQFLSELWILSLSRLEKRSEAFPFHA